MTTEIEDRLRSTLRDLADAAPLANPEHPRSGAVNPDRLKSRLDIKTLTLIGCAVVLVAALVLVGVETGRSKSIRTGPAVVATTIPAATTSLPPPGPVEVPNVVGLNALKAVEVLQAAGLTNSISELSCQGSIRRGRVIGQNPPAGFRVAPDSRVSLGISCNGTPQQ